ncbi:cytochrome P450 78A5-like [Nymphaea colorata]|nr:cytochrome P450 78A5-like [Nymphaea colorata]
MGYSSREPSWWLLALPVSLAASPLPLPSSFVALALCLLFVALLPHGGLAWILCRPPLLRGPAGLPLLGCLPAMASATPHRWLSAAARSLSALDLMPLSLGLTRVVICSSPDTAKDILCSHAFADRPVKESAYELLFHRAMGFAPYGDYWRKLRRVAASHLFSRRRMDAAAGTRRAVGEKMVAQILASMETSGVVKVKRILHLGSLNHVMEMVFGRSYDFSADGAQLAEMVREGYELLGVLNWGDHLPFLRCLDLQRVRRRCRNLVSRVNAFVGKIIEEHREKKIMAENGGGNDGDFVDALLSLEGENKLEDSDMIAVLWEMIFRGTDTVAILLEWILARMVLHPDVQRRAQSEIDSVVGSASGVEDSDLPKLTYLQAIVKEGLRMHPPGPLLSWARLAIHDVDVGGHRIPAGTTAMVNMWAITHDETIWERPKEFDPQRFMVGEEVSVLGSDLRLAPFGAGRRVCPGKAMGLASVQLWLAQLLQNFEWLPASAAGLSPEAVDLGERLRMSLEMENPLVCRAKPRRTAAVGGVSA